MDNREFDDLIKNKLESLSGNVADDGWDIFRQKWEESVPPLDGDVNEEKSDEQINDEFDAKLKRGMDSLRMPFNSAHWVQLKAKLIAEAKFRKQLFVAKTIEILMLALIVVGVLNVWPIKHDIYQIPINNAPMVASVQVDKLTAERYNDQKVLSDKAVEVIAMKISKSLEMLNPISSIRSFNSNSIENTTSQEKALSPIQNELKRMPTGNVLNTKINPELFPFLLQTKNVHEDINVEILDRSITSIGVQSIDLLELPLRPTGYPDIVLNKPNQSKDEKTFVSFAFGPDVALVNSPFDPVYNKDAYSTINTNYSVSAKLHKELGPVEIYAGLGYQNISYMPRVVNELYSKSRSQIGETSLQNIEFKQINVPVGVKYNVINKPSYQVYVAAGLDINIIAKANYEVKDFTLLTGGRPVPTMIQDKSNSGVNERSKLSQKEFNNGVFSGGSFRDNLYATANISLGLVKKVSGRTSIFVEPKYSHFISSQGIGPNKDKVHGVSVDLGVRYQLN